ncbi:MAG: hypothetical protein ACXAC5_02295 [Promethearchaeota archaeon]|jgi:hypothetical protein
MSTGADCVFVEKEPGQWWYRIQYGATKEYNEHGPFPSEKAGHDHLDQTYPNPGGYSLFPYVKK